MKKLFKILGILLLIVALVILGGITYVTQALPDIEAPATLHVEVTPERVARGEYLANNVCLCMDCHSTRDWYPGPSGVTIVGDATERVASRNVDRSLRPPDASDSVTIRRSYD